MNTPVDPSSSSSPPPSAGMAKYRMPLAIGGGVLVAVVAAIAVLRPPTPAVHTPDAPGGTVDGQRAWREKESLTVTSIEPPGVWLDVAKPAALKTVLTENAWLKQTASEPLGRGFLGGWAGFLGSAGEDVGLQKLTGGLIADLVTDAVLVQPMRLTWFAGWGGSTPALIVPRPSETLTTTFSGIRTAIERGGYLVDGCPGDPPAPEAPAPPVDATADGGTPPPAPVNPNRIEISRLLVADQPVFGALTRERLVFSKSAEAVVHAICGAMPEVSTTPGADVIVGLAPAKVGRDVHALAGLLGLKEAPTMAFKVDGSTLKPVGLAGALKAPDRLDTAVIPAATWNLVPEDLPVAVGVNLRLPQTLDSESLQAFYAGTATGSLVTRQALVLWQPHGAAEARTEVGIVWSNVADKEGLQGILSGPNRMEVRVVCDHLVASSTPTLFSRIEAACTQKAPSLSFAAPAVVQGLAAPTSVGVVVDLGRFLGVLLEEGYAPPEGKKPTKGAVLPDEITAAIKRLRELPRVGIFGDKRDAVLVPRGFSS